MLDLQLSPFGVLHTRSTLPMDRYPAIASRIKLIGGLDIAERRLPQDGRIGTRVAGREVDIRISSIPAVHGESLVLRLLPLELCGPVLLPLRGRLRGRRQGDELVRAA